MKQDKPLNLFEATSYIQSLDDEQFDKMLGVTKDIKTKSILKRLRTCNKSKLHRAWAVINYYREGRIPKDEALSLFKRLRDE